MALAAVFPGQGSQHSGMGKSLYEASDRAKDLFNIADATLGFSISNLMFNGTNEELTQTSVTQPAIFIHSVIIADLLREEYRFEMAAGHSLGEFSALVVAGALSFEDGLKLVELRAKAMQYACDLQPSTMAAIVGLEDSVVEEVCKNIPGVVVPANYNAPGQLVISGNVESVEKALVELKNAGAKLAKQLQVNGAFHSPLMSSAQEQLNQAIEAISIKSPKFPVYQNYTSLPTTDPNIIKSNLKAQLVSPVLWTQSIVNMINSGANRFIELGPGKVLQGLIKRIDKNVEVESISDL